MTTLTFLGTGGGRFVTLSQERSTGGLYVDDGARLHIDPGPGALAALRRNRIDPQDTDAILISHCHPDHYSNAEPLIEGIASGRNKGKGMLLASRSVIRGKGGIGPAISRYHQNKVSRVVQMRRGDTFRIGELGIRATRSFHSDPTTIGFRLRTRNGVISYVADTEYKGELVRDHRGARVLVLATTRPLNARIPHHLSTEDAARFASIVKPELVMLTHMGKRFLMDDPSKQADWIYNETGVKTIAALDDMTVEIEDEIFVRFPGGRV